MWIVVPLGSRYKDYDEDPEANGCEEELSGDATV